MSIRIAYEGAKIGFVFARRGLVMEACSSYYLPRLIGYVGCFLRIGYFLTNDV
jgi:enoyl-CoA hydratase/carnithine racemase